MKTYSEKLKDPRWQRKRLEILERDDFECRSCGSKENTLHVHHAFYEKGKSPWEYESRHLTTQCEPCHKMIEARLKLIHIAVGGNARELLSVMKLAEMISSNGAMGPVFTGYFSWAAEALAKAFNSHENMTFAEDEEEFEQSKLECFESIAYAAESMIREKIRIEECTKYVKTEEGE